MNLLKEDYKQIITNTLPTKTGDYINFKGLSITDIEDFFHFEIEETNGYDLDWSSEFNLEGKNYEIWGSIRRGSFNIELK